MFGLAFFYFIRNSKYYGVDSYHKSHHNETKVLPDSSFQFGSTPGISKIFLTIP